MTNEEIQQMMEFIREKQAQIAATLQQSEEQRIRDTPRLANLEESFQLVRQLAKKHGLRPELLERRVGNCQQPSGCGKLLSKRSAGV